MPEKLQTKELSENETIASLENRLRLREQYDQSLALLNRTGLLQILPESESFGLVGLDGKEYPMPKYEEVVKRLEANKEKLSNKIEQGFTKLLITPFAMPIGDLVERYKREIVKKHKEGKLLATKKDPKDPDQKLELNTETPVYVWDQYKQADDKGSLVYYPTAFSSNHGGKTKKELIKEGQAWDISLIEDLPNIPAERQGQTIGGRRQLEANKTPIEYLNLSRPEASRTNPYYGESGFTPEQWLTYAITHLESTNQVIEDYQGSGKLAYLTGAYFPGSEYVPRGYWDRDYRRADLGGSYPGSRNSYYGSRSSVRVV